MLSIGSPLFPFLPKNTNIFPFSSNNTTTGEPCDMRLWREYIFEVCQSKLYQPTTAGSNPLQGDTYPVDLIAWRLSVWNGNIANYPQWKCLHSETNDYTPLIKNFPNSLLEAMSTFKNLNQKKAFQVFMNIFYLMYAIPFHHAYIHILQIYIHENAQEAPNHVSSGCGL